MKNFFDFLYAFEKVKNEKENFCVITLTHSRGSVPQDLGARIICDENGLIYGTVGGGKVENKALEFAREKILAKEIVNQSVVWNLNRDVGMTCGGEVTFLFEFFGSHKEFVINVFGAGHVSQELVPLLLKLNAKVNVYDIREEWLSKFIPHINLKIYHTQDMPSMVKSLDDSSFVILITMGHSTDFPILLECLKHKKFPYLGVIGSKQKRNVIEKELRELNMPTEQINSFICPIGLDIGTNDPFEIAVSIVAQIIDYKDRK